MQKLEEFPEFTEGKKKIFVVSIDTLKDFLLYSQTYIFYKCASKKS